MARRCSTGTAAQDHLVDHEFAVVLAHGARGRLVTGVGQIGAVGPLPDLVEQPGKIRCGSRCVFPLGLGRQPRSRPACIGVSLI